MKLNVLRIATVAFVFSYLVFSLSMNVYAGHANNPDFCVENPTHAHCVSSPTPTPTSTPAGSPTASPTPTSRGVQRIRICQSTDSHSNPYTNPQVDQDAADGYVGNDNGQGDHYLEHTGPIWAPGIADHSWGDIIPPVAANEERPGHSGLNWNSQGQAIWNNNCNIPTDQSSPTPTPGDSGDVCANIDGVQTSVPNDYHLDASQRNCVQFELGGAPDSGIGGGSVLGASTMAGTGSAQDLMSLAFSVGAISASLGIRYAKKEVTA
jgi:hypothetical protein